MAGATSTLHILKEEFIKRTDEGGIIPPELRPPYDALDQRTDGWKTGLADPIYDALLRLPTPPRSTPNSPSALYLGFFWIRAC